jgi:2'-5' RNA ligase
MPLTEDLRSAAAALQEPLRRTAANVKWVEPQNLHVTLKFLGETQEALLEGIVRAMQAAAAGVEPFRLRLRGVGAFPNPRRPRVVWLGVVDGVEPLTGLAQRLEDGLAPLGVEPEGRPFRAHVTLGRVRNAAPGGRLAAEIEAMSATDVGEMMCTEIVLMRSQLSRSGPTYTPVETARLGSP